MRRPLPLPEGIDPSTFGVAEAKLLGVSRERTRSSSLTSPYHGVRTAGLVTGTLERATDARTAMPRRDRTPNQPTVCCRSRARIAGFECGRHLVDARRIAER